MKAAPSAIIAPSPSSTGSDRRQVCSRRSTKEYWTNMGNLLPQSEHATRAGLLRKIVDDRLAEHGARAESTRSTAKRFCSVGAILVNYWQGLFPFANQMLDGWERTSPVRAFPPNRHGLFDMIGNVREWTDDW
jgi:hypothetical protein